MGQLVGMEILWSGQEVDLKVKGSAGPKYRGRVEEES